MTEGFLGGFPEGLLDGFPDRAPIVTLQELEYVDIGLCATAGPFEGIWDEIRYHESDIHFVLDRASHAGVSKVLLTGLYYDDTHLNIAEARPEQCKVKLAIHTWFAQDVDMEGEAYLLRMEHAIVRIMETKPGLIGALGEIGLDYSGWAKVLPEVQRIAFRRQLHLLIKKHHHWGLPVTFMCRDGAWEDFITIIMEYLPDLHWMRCMMHSFAGSTAQMQTLVNCGFEIGVSGYSFKSRESLEMVRTIPLPKLHLATDAPYHEISPWSEVAQRYLVNARPLPPAKKQTEFERGKMVEGRNESCKIERVALVVAGLKGVDLNVVANAAFNNSKRFFRL